MSEENMEQTTAEDGLRTAGALDQPKAAMDPLIKVIVGELNWLATTPAVPNMAWVRILARRASAAIIELNRHAGQWRPIETAPKDGTEVLLAGPYSGYANRHEIWREVGEYLTDFNSWSPALMDSFAPPTHWQPLPAPPKAPVDEAVRPVR